MVRVREKPGIARATPYERDFHAWCLEQAALIRAGRVDEIDTKNVIEELESMGRSDRRALRSSYRVLLMHLLKWVHQPGKRSSSWRATIRRERDAIHDLETDSPSLAAEAPELVREAHARARREAADETGLPLSTFPADCPFSLAQLRDDDFLPE